MRINLAFPSSFHATPNRAARTDPSVLTDFCLFANNRAFLDINRKSAAPYRSGQVFKRWLPTPALFALGQG